MGLLPQGGDLGQVSPQFSHPWDKAGSQCPPPSPDLGSASNAARLEESRSAKAHTAPHDCPHAYPRLRPGPPPRTLPAIWETKASATRDMSAGRLRPRFLLPGILNELLLNVCDSRHLTVLGRANARTRKVHPRGGGSGSSGSEDPKVTARPWPGTSGAADSGARALPPPRLRVLRAIQAPTPGRRGLRSRGKGEEKGVWFQTLDASLGGGSGYTRAFRFPFQASTLWARNFFLFFFFFFFFSGFKQ